MVDRRPTMDETLMTHAHVMSRRGTCTRASVGVIIARDGRILSSGYNGAPRGMAHCSHPTDERSERSDSACATSVHAESNAIAFAARCGVSLDGAVLFTTLSPCLPCAQLIINAGINDVYVDKLYRDVAGVRLLRDANVGVYVWDGTYFTRVNALELPVISDEVRSDDRYDWRYRG